MKVCGPRPLLNNCFLGLKLIHRGQFFAAAQKVENLLVQAWQQRPTHYPTCHDPVQLCTRCHPPASPNGHPHHAIGPCRSYEGTQMTQVCRHTYQIKNIVHFCAAVDHLPVCQRSPRQSMCGIRGCTVEGLLRLDTGVQSPQHLLGGTLFGGSYNTPANWPQRVSSLTFPLRFVHKCPFQLRSVGPQPRLVHNRKSPSYSRQLPPLL